jgi:transposase
MKTAATLPTHVPALQQLVLEQQHMIETLKEQLRLSLRRQFGARNEFVNVDQLGLFALSSNDDSAVIEIDVGTAEVVSITTADDNNNKLPAERKKAIRVLKDLPRDIRIIDIPDSEKICSCCNGALHPMKDETAEHLEYVPAILKIIETRRKKYACNGCHGDIKRAKEDFPPLFPKGMASPSLIAFLIVCKYADHLPLYRISQILKRMGIEISDSLMSEWLLQTSELFDDLMKQMILRVLATGHVFTDDTILPMQNKDPDRNTTTKSRLWVYAAYTESERQRPLVVYDFSVTRRQAAPVGFLKGYEGYLQADAFPGYDTLFRVGDVQEVACWAHARRKFVEVTSLMKTPGRAHTAIAFIKKLYAIESQIRRLKDDEKLKQRQAQSRTILAQFKAWLDVEVNGVLPKSALGNAIGYTLKNWDALCRYTEHGFLEADNNFAERCMRPVALGRKNYLFVGSERAGKAAALYYSLIESCKLNKVNPLTYMTYVLSNVRNKAITLLMPHEFHQINIVQVG